MKIKITATTIVEVKPEWYPDDVNTIEEIVNYENAHGNPLEVLIDSNDIQTVVSKPTPPEEG